ncbi:MAG: xanthine dehydrogenase family protein molybdopterin-binding subunit [Candidatus Caldarchaeum sp.]|nr:xanthine dehydrogenase family protein molybdopterin-binding subunit [Candidatus Caldarchaeales archaeon]
MNIDEEAYSVIREWLSRDRFIVVKKDVIRYESVAGVRGMLRYVEDYVDGRCLHARIVRSVVPHGLLKSIKLNDSRGHLVTARDVPGENQVGYTVADQPVLAEKKVRFYGEPVALVVSDNGYSAEDLLEKVEVDVEPLPAVYDVFEALQNRVLIHEEKGSNIAATAQVRKGDVKVGERESDEVVEKTYVLSPQDHVYMETEAALAIPSIDGVTVISQAQYPHLAQKTVARVLGIPYSKVSIIQPAIGGAFGGKDDMGPIVSAQAALACWKLGKPVYLQYSREESFTSHCKRDPAVIKCRTGASRDGLLKFLDAEVIFDSGAYANRGPYTLWRACVHVSGPYRIPHVNVVGKLVYTNKVYQGSFRGFGNPQAEFAAERQMDELARRLGIDPIEFRLKNLLRPGDLSATSQPMPEDTGIAPLVEKMRNQLHISKKRRENGYQYGYGFAVAWHGISTSRGVPDWGSATLTVLRDGSVVVSSGIVEFGQGTHTAIKQVVAEVLGIPYEWVKLEGGTSYAPDTGATHGSRGLTLGGSAALVAAGRVRRRIVKMAAEMLEANPGDIEIADGKVFVKGAENKMLDWRDVVAACYSKGVDLTSSGYFFLKKDKFDESRGQGHAYTVYSFSAVLVEVRVDTETGKVEVTNVWPGAACGRIINPGIALGQIHGSVVQSLGYSLTERMVFEEGRLLTASLMDYLIPSASETPRIHDPVYYEDICPHGPLGAKGLAELALIPIPAAVANAIKDAVGVDVDEIPVVPEKLIKQLRKQ